MKRLLANLSRRLYNSPFKRVWHRLPGPVKFPVQQIRHWFSEADVPFEKIPRVYVTLLCNLRCPYCSDGLAYDKSEMSYEGLSGDEWIEVIDQLPGRSVIFTGGEPTLHPELPRVINSIDKSYIVLYTNLAYDLERFLSQLQKPVHFFSSFHPNNPQVSVEKSIAALKLLRDHPMCSSISSHHLIKHSSNGATEDFERYRAMFKSEGFDLLLYDDQFEVNVYGSDMCNFKIRKEVQCTMDRILIGPDGKRHICVSKMVRRTKDSIVALGDPKPTMICYEYGLCSPCDEVAQIVFDLKKAAPES